MSLEKKIRKFLQGPKKGEAYELRSGLVSQYKYERKDAIQRVIQAMTVGKDVSSLFPDVLKNIATYDLEQKKLVYLYLMNYAKSHPELCILAVNTFVQDTEDPNPLIRALAIRTMGCVRVTRMVDFIEIPLKRTLSDDNPYVRKTAAICVAKLFDLSPRACVEFGFLDQLRGLIKDSNPMVVANALNSLFEIKDMNVDLSLVVLEFDSELIKTLLMCLNECTEWGRITILDTLTKYEASSSEEALHIIDRATPQLQHANPSVVLSSIKVILHHLGSVKMPAQRSAILKKLSSPLVSLVSSSIPEAQYVGLKNIRIILEKYPQILSKELRVFFIKYSDPLYLKLEKLEIMVRLANESNSTLLLSELKEYAMEFESALVIKAIKSIGSVAIKLPNCVIKAVNILSGLIDQRGDSLIVNETTTVFTNILRRYPGKNDFITLIVPIISSHVSEINKTEATASYIWLFGEYPKYFSNLKDHLDSLVDKFLEYESSIQLHILTSVVKINMASSSNKYSNHLQRVLELATKECESADVRDKAYIYWRLLSSTSTDSQKKVILAKLPPIETTIPSFNPIVLEHLIKELSTLSSVYHRPSYTFIDPNVYSPVNEVQHKETAKNGKSGNMQDLTNLAKQEIINAKNENLLDLDDNEADDDSSSTKSNNEASLLDELNDLFSTPAPQGQNAQTSSTSTNDILSLFGPNTATTNQNTSTGDINRGLSDLNLETAPSNSNTQQKTDKVNNDLLDLF